MNIRELNLIQLIGTSRTIFVRVCWIFSHDKGYQLTDYLSLVVKGVLTDKGNWDLNFHNDNLPLNIVNHLVVLHAPRDMGRILLNEKNTNARHFTVQSTYDLQRENVHYIDDNWTMVGIGKNHTKFKLLCGWQL
jgi:predicted P-loop ATPase/GTPase